MSRLCISTTLRWDLQRQSLQRQCTCHMAGWSDWKPIRRLCNQVGIILACLRKWAWCAGTSGLLGPRRLYFWWRCGCFQAPAISGIKAWPNLHDGNYGCLDCKKRTRYLNWNVVETHERRARSRFTIATLACLPDIPSVYSSCCWLRIHHSWNHRQAVRNLESHRYIQDHRSRYGKEARC